MPVEVMLAILSGAIGIAAVGFMALAGLLLVRPIRSHVGRVFLAATLVSCVTFATLALSYWFPVLTKFRIFASAPLGAWAIFLIVCVKQVTHHRIVQSLFVALAIFWALDILIALGALPLGSAIRYLSRMGMAIIVCVAAEQLIRNAGTVLRWSIKHAVLALIVCAGFDLLFYAYALVNGRAAATLAVFLAFAWSLAVPLFAVSAARNPSWDVGIHVSRNVVFHTFTIVVIGAALLLLSGLGYLVARLDVQWGTIIQGLIALVSITLLATALISQTFRSKVRGFVDRNFYSYRFDYREEWLRFTRALTSDGSESVFATVGSAFQNLLDCAGNAVFLKSTSNTSFELKHAYGVSALPRRLDFSENQISAIAAPMDLRQTASVAALFQNNENELDANAPRFLIPLKNGDELIALVLVPATRSGLSLDREVLDLLSVAAQQAASYVQQALTTEELIVARQFDSFNKMSAFVVHDLKNLAAQLSLMSANAHQHKNNPAFQQDMIETVEHVTSRMRTLLGQLSQPTNAVDPPAVVDVQRCIAAALKTKPSLKVKPQIECSARVPVITIAHEDRLARIIGHLVQNADESITSKNGSIIVDVKDTSSSEIRVDVTDTGSGMSDSFVRDRLFRPFASTKEKGMGIGVFESANYLRDIGGALRVASTLGKGTCFSILLPRAREA